MWVGIAGDGKLSSVENWLDTTAPANGDVLNFSAATGAISLDADLGAVVPSTLVLGSKVVSISSGSLTVSTLTNACTLAVASGASLTVTGDLVAYDGNGTLTLLYSNEGTVRIGRAVCTTADGGRATTTKQYEVVTANTQPIRTGGFLFDRVDNRLYWRLESGNSAPGAWVVGANGFAYGNIVNEKQMRYFVQKSPVTLYSSADWTLSGCGQKSATFGELHVYDGSASLTIDTSDYDDPTVSRVVTLEGRLVAEKPVTIKGCGTVQVNTTGAHPELPADLQHTCISNTTLSVTETATLQINAGRKITGNGTVSLAAGTTLVLPSDVIAAGERCIPGLALPETGTATLRIDGARLRAGDHVLLDSVPENYASLTIDRTGTAIDGRHAYIIAKDGQLVLNIVPDGLVIIFR